MREWPGKIAKSKRKRRVSHKEAPCRHRRGGNNWKIIGGSEKKNTLDRINMNGDSHFTEKDSKAGH